MRSKFYTNEIKDELPLKPMIENQTIMHPRVLGQSARESYVDYGNPRIKEARVSPSMSAHEIQKILDSMDSQDGGIVHLATGTFYLNGDIVIPDYVTFEGEGTGNTIIDFRGESYSVKVVGAGGNIYPGSFTKNTRLRDFTVINSGTSAAISCEAFIDFLMENVHAKQNEGHGFRFAGGLRYNVNNCFSEENLDEGFRIESLGSTPHNSFTFTGCVADGHDNGPGFGIINDGIALQETVNGALIGCEARSNFNGIDLRADSIRVVGGSYWDNFSYGINITGTENIIGMNIFQVFGAGNQSAAIYNDGTDNLIRSNIGATDSP